MINRIKDFIHCQYFSKIIRAFLALIVFFIILITLVATGTYFSLIQFSAGNFTQAQKIALQTKKSSQLLTIFTFGKSHSALACNQGLEIISLSANIFEQMQQPSLESVKETDRLSFKFDQLSQKMQQLNQEINRSWLLKLFLSPQVISNTISNLDLAADISKLVSLTADNQTKVAVLLQNKDEIRASGGFLGSMAMISLNKLQIQQIDFYDAYDINGQITTLLPPVIGAKDYLTQGKGLNFTDANWHADFPTVCSQIDTLIKQVDLERNITIALNQQLIEQIIDVVGPIYLPDYQVKLTGDNFTQLARQSRSDFFKGDKQKKYFLEAAFQQIKIRLEETNFDQKKELFFLIKNNLDKQEILLNAKTKSIQNIFTKHNWTGALESHFSKDGQKTIYLIESNVGINKANQKVEREVALNLDQDNSNYVDLELTFFNNNQPLDQDEIDKIKNNPDLLQAPHLGYVNYLRIITQPETEVTSVVCEQTDVPIKENGIISTAKESRFRQTGFLITVFEQDQTKCLIRLTTKVQLDEKVNWIIKQQPGLN